MLPLHSPQTGRRIKRAVGNDGPEAFMELRPDLAHKDVAGVAGRLCRKAEVWDPIPEEGLGDGCSVGLRHGDGVAVPGRAIQDGEEVAHALADGKRAHNVHLDVLDDGLGSKGGLMTLEGLHRLHRSQVRTR